jgi:hypothetical protein
MPICEVCGEEDTSVTKCKTCNVKFCEYCGSVEDRQCIECIEYSDDDDNYEDDKEDSSWL